MLDTGNTADIIRFAYCALHFMLIKISGAHNEQFLRNDLKQHNVLAQMCGFNINNKHFNVQISVLLARFLHEMDLYESVVLMTSFEIVSYSVAVLQFDLQYALL